MLTFVVGMLPKAYTTSIVDLVTGNKSAVEQGMLQKQYYSAYVSCQLTYAE